jgi:hypothetical protein
MLPRMILGAMLGYLVVWSGSLWTAIVAHMFNNTIAILLFYKFGDTATPVSDDVGSQWSVYIMSGSLFVLFIYWFRKWSRWEEIRAGYLGIGEH